MQILLAAIVVFVLGSALVWMLVPAIYGLPPLAVRPARARRALQLAKLQQGELFYDLGCGHGQVLVVAAREFGARAVGIDVGPMQCLISWANALRSGVRSQVRVAAGDFFHADLSRADVVYAYLTSRYAARLQAKLERELHPGARVVTIAFELSGWQAQSVDREALIYVYTK